jgi:hypothetical protein
MASFTIRVELRDANREQYNKLYERMAAEGFTDIIRETTSGKAYKMPPGEYNYIGNLTRATVLEKAERAASGVVKDYAVLVTESAGRTWNGLTPVK